MKMLALLVLLVLPASVSSQTVYFRADAETGTLSEWTAGGGGYCNQCCNPDRSSNLCVATTEQAHSGTRSFKLDVTNPGSGIQGLKLARWDYGTDPTKGMQQGQTYYFSSWYYIAAGYTGTAGQWTNNMQWKTDGGGYDPTIVIGFRPLNGVLQVAVDHWACQRGAVPCLTFAGLNSSRGFYTQMTPRPVPRNQWFHLETRYTAARSNGRITVWQDGVQILDMSGAQFNTWDSHTTSHQSLAFFVLNYVDSSITGDQKLYVDGIYITNYRVGASQTTPATPPAAPTNLQITATQSTSLSLSWTAASGATGHKVYHGLAPGQYGTPTDVGKVTSATLGGLTAGSTYYVAVTAYNAAGSSGYSNEVSAQTGSSCLAATVTFDNPAPPGSPGSYVNGLFQGLNFGTNQWRWWSAYGAEPTNHLYFASSTGTSRAWTFSPAPRILQSIRVSTGVNGTLTLSDDRGQQRSQSIATGTLYTVPTGWTLPSTTVTVAFTAGWSLNVDDVRYACP